MSQFLYYLGGVEAVGGKVDLAGAKLGYAFEGEKYMARECSRGPDGGKGVLVSAVGDIGLVGYFPDRQTWRKHPDLDLWVGWFNGEMPGPADLARGRQLNGGNVELGDGREWLIPHARRFVADGDSITPVCVLPFAYNYAGAKGWNGNGIKARYEPLWRIAVEYWNGICGKGVERLWRVQAGAVALSANYRVSELEVGVLQLLDDQTVEALMDEVVDYKTFEAWMERKKKDLQQSDGPISGCGSTGETPGTGQPSGSG